MFHWRPKECQRNLVCRELVVILELAFCARRGLVPQSMRDDGADTRLAQERAMLPSDTGAMRRGVKITRTSDGIAIHIPQYYRNQATAGSGSRDSEAGSGRRARRDPTAHGDHERAPMASAPRDRLGAETQPAGKRERLRHRSLSGEAATVQAIDVAPSVTIRTFKSSFLRAPRFSRLDLLRIGRPVGGLPTGRQAHRSRRRRRALRSWT